MNSVVNGVTCNDFGPSDTRSYISDCIIPVNTHITLDNSSIIIGLSLDGLEKLSLNFGSGLVWRVLPLEDGKKVVTCFGLDDDFDDSVANTRTVFMNTNWGQIADKFGKPDELWDANEVENISNANIFTTSLKIEDQIKYLYEISSGLSSTVKLPKDAEMLSMSEIHRRYNPIRFLQFRSSILYERLIHQLEMQCYELSTKCIDINVILHYIATSDREALCAVFVKLHSVALRAVQDASKSRQIYALFLCFLYR